MLPAMVHGYLRQRINDYIRHTLVNYADAVFDVVPVLIEGLESEGRAKYCGHPNEAGCKAWADALVSVLEETLSNGKL